MLAKLLEFDIIKCMDGRKKRNGNLFKRVANALAEAGYVRTAEQIRVRWKHMKSMYYGVQRQNRESGHSRQSCPHMHILHDLLAEQPTARAEEHGAKTRITTEAESDVDTLELLELSAVVRKNEAGTPIRRGILQPAQTNSPNHLSASSTPRKRVESPNSSLAIQFERFNNECTERHRQLMEQKDKAHKENLDVFQGLVAKNTELVDFIMDRFRRPPSTAQALQPLFFHQEEQDP